MHDAEALERFLQRGTGIDFSGTMRPRLARELTQLSRSVGLPEAELAERVQWDVPLRDALLDRVTVRETFFFREAEQLRFVVDRLRDGASHDDRRVVWSAGCASGEEAYTTAILLERAGLLDMSLIVATDIAPAALAAAARGRYSARSLRMVDASTRAGCFDTQGGRVIIHDRYRQAVKLLRGNVVAGSPPPHSFHVVLCRNLLMYMTPESLDAAARSLRDALRPDGWLVTSSADPLLDIAGLVPVATGQGFVYQRGERQPVPRPRRPAVSKPAPRPRLRPPTPPTVRPARADAVAPTPPVTPPEPTSEQVERLAGRGRHGAALALALEMVRADPVDSRARLLLAMVHLDAGDLKAAYGAARQALFLEPEASDIRQLHAHLDRQLRAGATNDDGTGRA